MSCQLLMPPSRILISLAKCSLQEQASWSSSPFLQSASRWQCIKSRSKIFSPQRATTSISLFFSQGAKPFKGFTAATIKSSRAFFISAVEEGFQSFIMMKLLCTPCSGQLLTAHVEHAVARSQQVCQGWLDVPAMVDMIVNMRR